MEEMIKCLIFNGVDVDAAMDSVIPRGLTSNQEDLDAGIGGLMEDEFRLPEGVQSKIPQWKAEYEQRCVIGKVEKGLKDLSKKVMFSKEINQKKAPQEGILFERLPFELQNKIFFLASYATFSEAEKSAYRRLSLEERPSLNLPIKIEFENYQKIDEMEITAHKENPVSRMKML